MNRRRWCVAGSLFLLGGCMKPQMPAGPPQKPEVPAEMKKLERMVGNWTGTAELTPEGRERMMKHMPAGAKEPPAKFTGGGKGEWALGGTALKFDGWHDMGDGQKENMAEYFWWDAKAGVFRNWFISDWGKTGQGTLTACDSCDGFCVKIDGTDADGAKLHWDGCMKFVDKDTREWAFTMTGAMGELSIKGTDKRQK